jgi:acetyl-CoA acetyltransferase
VYEEVVIVEALRTPIGKIGGSLKDVPAEDIACLVIKEMLERTGIDPAITDEVIIGQTKISADAPNIARTAALMAGIPIDVPAYTVSRQCGSGMQAVICGAQAIQCNQAEVIIAGGTESMSNASFYLRHARYGYNTGNGILFDSNVESQFRSQPQEMFGVFNMGMTAENLAERYRISREAQDVFAFESQKKANAAIKEGRFKEEIVPVLVKQKKGDPVIFDTDEFPRQTTLEKMSKLPPVFKENGTVTAVSNLRPSTLTPIVPAAIIWDTPTAIITKVSKTLDTTRASTPMNFSIIPGTVTVSRLRYSFAKNIARKATPIPLAIVYQAPDIPYKKPYSDIPVVEVPPSHSPVPAATHIKTPSPAP